MSAYRVGRGLVAIVEAREPEAGTLLWVGELRTLDDRPVLGVLSGTEYVAVTPELSQRIVVPVTVGPTEQDVLGALRRRAQGQP